MKAKNRAFAVGFFLQALLFSTVSVTSVLASQPNLVLMQFSNLTRLCERMLTKRTLHVSEERLVFEDALMELPLTAHSDVLKNTNLPQAFFSESFRIKFYESVRKIPDIARKTAVGAFVDLEFGHITGFKFQTTEQFREFLSGGGALVFRAGKYTELDVSGIKLRKKDVKCIAGLSGLRKLNVAETSVKASDVEILAKLSNLTTLDLTGNAIGDVGVEPLARLSNLTTLYVGSNEITVTGARAISKLSNLTTLDLSWNYTVDIGAIAIAKLQKLTDLYIAGNYVSDTGVLEISKLSNLTILDLGENQIGDVGAFEIAKCSKKLKVLHIPADNLSDSTKAMLKETFKNGSLHIYPNYYRRLNENP